MDLKKEDGGRLAEEVSPLHRKLIRALVTEEWSDAELAKAMNVYRRLSRKRRSGPSGTGEHLTTRRGKDRKDKIVVKDGEKLISTGENASEGADEEHNPYALLDLAAYRRDFLEEKKAEYDPLGYDVNFVLREYVDSQKPGPKVPDRARKVRTWGGTKNHARHLMDSFEGWRLSDIDVDTGRWYYADRLKRAHYKGKRKEGARLKDSPVSQELQLLNRAIAWFVRKRKLNRTPSAFEMPSFTKVERDFFVYSELVELLWACLGFSAADGWKRTADVPPATQEWLVRFFLLYILTGTRFANNALLFWGFNDAVGCIDAANGVIWRYGREEIVSKTKPRRRSDLGELIHALVKKWEERDRKLAATKGIPFGLVIHDENGEPPPNFAKIVKAALDRSGLGKSSHLLKHAGVSLMAALGYTIREIAEYFGNHELTLRRSYLHIDWDRIERRVEERIPLRRFGDLALRSPPKTPAASAKALTGLLRARGRLKS